MPLCSTSIVAAFHFFAVGCEARRSVVCTVSVLSAFACLQCVRNEQRKYDKRAETRTHGRSCAHILTTLLRMMVNMIEKSFLF